MRSTIQITHRHVIMKIISDFKELSTSKGRQLVKLVEARWREQGDGNEVHGREYPGTGINKDEGKIRKCLK